MSDILIDLLPITLLLIACIGFKSMKPISNFNDNYLSINTVKHYKGLFATIIVLHHLSANTQSGIVFSFFKYIGIFAAGAFFFYSGYGLQKSYMTKGNKYRKDFLKKRIPCILIPYVIVIVLYFAMKLVDGKFYSFKEIIVSIMKGNTIVPFSWYIITIIIFYFVYWILMTICKKKYYKMIIGGVIWYILHAFCCIRLGFRLHWYVTSHILILGMMWALWENKIIKAIKRYQIIIPLIMIIFIIIFLSEPKIISNIPIKGIRAYVDMTISFLFAISTVLFSMKTIIGNKILEFLGKISFEIYLIHGLFMELLRSNRIYIENEFIWSSLVVIFTIVSAFLLHHIFDKLLTKYKNMVGV